MTDGGSILLVSCYELGHQPLAVASPLAFLERAGFAPEAIDISVEPFDTSKAARARLVAISVPMHTALRLGVRVATLVRQINPTCHICFYGLYASLNADYLLAHCGDSVIGGEFESALVALVEALEAGSPGDVEGVHVRGRAALPVLERLSFPQPSRAALPGLKKYAHLDKDGRKELVGYVEASRGCLHLCLHCPGHSLSIVRAMRAEFPSLTFDFTAKVEHILEREEIFPELRRLGCAFMISAVESLSESVLANLEKGHARADVTRALGIVRDAGIAFRPTWVAFTPWTTLEDYLEIFEFVERKGLIDHVDPVQFTLRLLIRPGSSLLTRDAITPYLGPRDQGAFIHRWTHPDPRMDRLQREASQLVESTASEDAAATFYRLKALAQAAAGLPQEPAPALVLGRRRPPRLTEAWFC